MRDDKEETPMERFENLAKRLFSIVKKDEEKVEQTVEEVIRTTRGPFGVTSRGNQARSLGSGCSFCLLPVADEPYDVTVRVK